MKYTLAVSKEARRTLKRLKQKDKTLYERVQQEIEKLLEHPEFGKPLRYDLKHCRRVHVGSFVLTYEINQDIIRVMDFDHHDKIYDKR